MARLNPQERKRLLQRRAKRELEAAGFGLKKLQDGSGYIVINGKTEQPIGKFDTIESVGQFFGIWGQDTPDAITEHSEAVLSKTGKWPKPPDKDRNGRDTPETAAIREQAL